MAKKRIVVTDSDGMYKSSEGLDARLAALDVATDAEVPRTAFECADRSAEIFALDQLIEEQHEKLKTLRKQREDLVRSLLVGCAGLRQHDLFQEPDAGCAAG
jgi:hypothetical protein